MTINHIYNKKIDMDKKIGATIDNILSKLHEAYRDCEEHKKRVINDFNTRSKNFKADDSDFDKMSALAAANNKSFDVLNNIIKNKTELLKVQATLIRNVKDIDATEDKEKETKIVKAAMSLSEDEMKKIRDLAKNTDYEFDED